VQARKWIGDPLEKRVLLGEVEGRRPRPTPPAVSYSARNTSEIKTVDALKVLMMVMASAHR
jgi:hypothetical protein